MPVHMPTLVQQIKGYVADAGLAGPCLIQRWTFDADTSAATLALAQTVNNATAIGKASLRPDASAEWINAAFIVEVAALDLAWVPAAGETCTYAGREAPIVAIEPGLGSGAIKSYRFACGTAR